MITGKPRSYRTLFLSDIHLGSPHSQAERLVSFLQDIDFKILCLVGDIFDAPVELSKPHEAVVRLILGLLRRDVRVIYIPGNHDAWYRDACGDYGSLSIVRSYVHIGRSGRTILVTHGDEWTWFPTGSLMHRIDRLLPFPFWELLRKLARGLMRRHVTAFEQRALKAKGAHDLVLCGHVHFPALNYGYANTGDWVTHCSAIVEHFDGTLELVYG